MSFLEAFLISYSDSSFTNPHEVVRPDEPEECTGNFTHMGAKYWGFETSRHKATNLTDNNDFSFNDDAYHWIHIGLNSSAVVSRISISTKWFTGNQVPEVAIEMVDEHGRTEVVARTSLSPDAEHTFDIEPTVARECLVRCYHEGGIARVNLFGESQTCEASHNLFEQATISHVSNEHYGKPQDAVAGNREVDYMLGWESARAGFGEHALFHLEKAHAVSEIIVDTYLHRLNPPLSCHIFGINLPNEDKLEDIWGQRPSWKVEFTDGLQVIPADFQSYMQEKSYRKEPTNDPSRFTIMLDNQHPDIWKPLVSFGRLRADTWHRFRQMEHHAPVTHILYSHYPNGGIHGLKAYGVGVGAGTDS
jgi:allantoicase